MVFQEIHDFMIHGFLDGIQNRHLMTKSFMHYLMHEGSFFLLFGLRIFVDTGYHPFIIHWSWTGFICLFKMVRFRKLGLLSTSRLEESVNSIEQWGEDLWWTVVHFRFHDIIIDTHARLMTIYTLTRSFTPSTFHTFTSRRLFVSGHVIQTNAMYYALMISQKHVMRGQDLWV